MARTRLERTPYIRVFSFDIDFSAFLFGFYDKIIKVSFVGNTRE